MIKTTKKNTLATLSNRKKCLGNAENTVLSEAMQYIETALDILKQNGKLHNNVYTDKKYVRMAGHTAYIGVLYALDNANLFTNTKKNQRRNVEDYEAALAKQNKKMLDYFVSCYQQLQLVAGNDGVGHKNYLRIAIADAQQIIKWAAKRVN
ncbi:MAG: DUF5618 family protein [Bacteroidia bacterium]